MKAPRVHYADSGGHSIAYRYAGAGRVDIALVLPSTGTIEMLWEPPADRLLAGQQTFARVIAFDRRGIGLSSPTTRAATLEEQLEDLDAVLGAARAERVVLYSEAEGSMLALLYAATRPERVSHLILLHGMARVTSAEGYEWPWDEEHRREQFIAPMLHGWGTGVAGELLAPVLAGEDERLVEWWGRWERVSGAPSYVRGVLELAGEMDVRGILDQVEVPTLILNRPEATMFNDRHAEYLAERISGAELRQLPGRDAISFGDGMEAQIEAMRQFVTGERAAPASGRRSLATVLFTDIVASTERAASLGDAEWRRVLEEHDRLSRRLVAEHGGTTVKSTGDGHLATFDGPARGVHCAEALCDSVSGLGIELRAGLHTGEVEMIGADVGGMAVHIGARIAAQASAGEVLVSSTVKDLVVGSGLRFADRGSHELKGIAESWRLYELTSDAVPTRG